MQSPTLLDVRYYDETFHPSRFRGKGWRGFLIRVLNWVRYWIETYVQYLVLKFDITTLDPTETSKEIVEGAVTKFWADVRRERLHSYLSDPALSPEAPGDLPVTGVLSRQGRYEFRRGERLVHDFSEENEPARPISIEGLAQRYGTPGRESRYSMGVSVMEDHISELEKNNGKD